MLEEPIDVAAHCAGTGAAPRYTSPDGDALELADPGDPWRHADGRLGLGDLGAREELDARLRAGTFDVTAESLALRAFFSLRGRRPGFGNPNGELPPHAGSLLRFARNGLRVGRPSRIMEGIDDRVSLPTVERLALYRDPLAPAAAQEGWGGAAIFLDEPSDQFTLNQVNASCCTYGLLSTTAIDAVRIRALHTARVTFPLYFAAKSNWYVTVADSCFADGDGPCLIQGKHHPFSFQNVLFVRQGRRPTHLPACNVVWRANNSSVLGGNVEDPGKTFPFSDGRARRAAARIPADGMRLEGHGNHIATHFKGAYGADAANLRLTAGASRNIVQSRFSGGEAGALDLVIEAGCEANVVHVSPGMRIVDRGTSTHFVGAPLAGEIVSG